MKIYILLLIILMSSGCVLLTIFRPNLVLTPDNLPDAIVGQPYSVKISVAKEETPVGGADIKNGELPAGLKLQKLGAKGEIAEISGTPTNAGDYEFMFDVWCYGTNVTGQTIEKKYKIAVKEK